MLDIYTEFGADPGSRRGCAVAGSWVRVWCVAESRVATSPACRATAPPSRAPGAKSALSAFPRMLPRRRRISTCHRWRCARWGSHHRARIRGRARGRGVVVEGGAETRGIGRGAARTRAWPAWVSSSPGPGSGQGIKTIGIISINCV